jgi:hypothetical protein
MRIARCAPVTCFIFAAACQSADERGALEGFRSAREQIATVVTRALNAARDRDSVTLNTLASSELVTNQILADAAAHPIETPLSTVRSDYLEFGACRARYWFFHGARRQRGLADLQIDEGGWRITRLSLLVALEAEPRR